MIRCSVTLARISSGRSVTWRRSVLVTSAPNGPASPGAGALPDPQWVFAFLPAGPSSPASSRAGPWACQACGRPSSAATSLPACPAPPQTEAWRSSGGSAAADLQRLNLSAQLPKLRLIGLDLRPQGGDLSVPGR